MTQKINDEQMALITRIVKIHAPCYTVSGYEVEDIEQEGFIICFKAFAKWDGVRPLENFLVTCLSNRLKTFVRDKNRLQGGFARVSQLIQNPIDIEHVDWDTERSLITEDVVSSSVEYRDLLDAIDQYLPISLRKDYLLMQAGVKINRGRKKKIREYIAILFKELQGDTEELDELEDEYE